jgi:predicted PurR-regulated permease PerM
MTPPNSPPALHRSRFYARSFALVTVAAMGYLLFRLLSPFFVSGLWAGLLAFMFYPLHRRLLSRWEKPTLAAGLVTALAVVTLLLPLSFFVGVFVRQATDLLGRFRAEAHDRKLPALQLVLELRPIRMLLETAEAFTSLSKDEVIAKAAEAAQEGLQFLASAGGSLVLGAFSAVTTFFLTLFLMFFFLRDGASMLRRAIHLVPLSTERKDALRLHLGAVTRAVVMGTMVTALVQGTLLGMGFAIAGLPSPVVFGSVGALTSLVPVVGTALVWVPATLSLVATGSNGWAIFLALWCGILVVGSDNVVRPLIISGRTNVSTLLVITGVMGGVSAFGVTGLFVGPLLLTLAAALLSFGDESSFEPQPTEVNSSSKPQPRAGRTPPESPPSTDASARG